MSRNDNKQDKEVYVLGSGIRGGKKDAVSKWWWIIAVMACLAGMSAGLYVIFHEREETPDYYFEPEDADTTVQSVTVVDSIGANTLSPGYIEVVRDTVNTVALDVFIPRNLTMSLAVGMPDRMDSTIVFAAMAADIRKDNMQIVGDFVMAGEQLSRGVAKRGFCAVVDNTISVGVGTETSLLQQAVDSKGFFFRQYPLVHNGELVENNPKNVSVRRALAVRDGQVIMVESKTRESFHDFSLALIGLGVSDAIYLVGGDAWGWYRDKEHRRHEFGEELADVPENVSYILWRTERTE